jgi:hypothetical protein
MLQAAHKALVPGGHLLFDIRAPTSPPFKGWPTLQSPQRVEDPSFGPIEWWIELLRITGKRVRYRLHYSFERSGDEVVSTDELIFRPREEVVRSLTDAGFSLEHIYGDWDHGPLVATSPEMIFVAERI